ncbi:MULTISPECIES: ABC transporter permease [Olivibacter]|uniref:ABC transporter permease n=1 Tax=Olivibacter jilunii TaxID=985016 RepID=A0ABW6AXB5_9SPHI|nr:ABC transporter permease [Olivibacter sp. UJ_SKK_5.1]MDX3912091.1 ABC transporter permease [Pseudosphingobacterium sp.]
MINHHLKATFRYLWRNRLFTGLNILGLAIGISASWIIFRMVSFEFSYDKFEPDRERIFQLTSSFKTPDGRDREMAVVPKGVLPAMLREISGLDEVSPVYYQHYETAQTAKSPLVENLSERIATLPGYFKMIGYQWLAGNAQQALKTPEQVILTASRAQYYFPGKRPSEIIGQTITYNDTIQKTVSGVLADLGYLNSFPAQEFFPIDQESLTSTDWSSLSSNELLFVKLKKGVSTKTVLDQLNALNEKINSEVFKQRNFKSHFKLLQLKDKHFATQSDTRTANKSVLFGLVGIAFFLLALACINYINLTTAQIPQRAKEISVRKTLGSTSGIIIRSYLLETFVVCLLAVALSLFLTFLSLRVFAEYIPEGMDNFTNYPGMIAFSIALISIITVLAGLYPSWLAIRVQAVRVLKGETKQSIRGYQLNLRKGLIVFQFVIAQVFVICSIIIGQQLKYTLDKDLGFEHEAILTVEIPYKLQQDSLFQGAQFVLKQRLAQHPEIAAVSLGDLPMIDRMTAWLMDYRGKNGTIQKQVMFKNIDNNYLDLYQIPLLAGRNVQLTDTVRELLLNETALKAFGFSRAEEAIGQTLYQGNTPRTIVGVIKDFHQFNLKSTIDLLGFTAQKPGLTTFNIKLSSPKVSSWKKAIALIEQEWKQVYPTVPFSYQFYDDTIKSLYRQEHSTSRLVNVATAITLLISCLGLYGLAAFTAFQRTKEIGIRKVLGATVGGITSLLSKDFIKLVLIALMIATPIAWWAMNKWLENFAFKITVQWWMFAFAGLGAVTIALLTVSYQAIKAAIANPVDSLRSE